MFVDVEEDRLVAMNNAITEKLQQLGKQMHIRFLNSSLYNYKENEAKV